MTSASLGLVRVSAHDTHRRAIGPFLTSQLHSARCRLAHSWYSLSSTAPACSLSSGGAMTRSAMSSSENPSALLQFRHTEFSKDSRWPQLGHVKSRMEHSP